MGKSSSGGASRSGTCGARPSHPHLNTLVAEAGNGAVAVFHATGVNHLNFGPAAGRFFTLCDDGALRAFDLAVGRPSTPVNGHEYLGWTVDASTDGNWLVSSSADERAGLWKFVRAKPLPRLELDQGVVGSAWPGPTNGLASVTTNGDLHCWNPLAPRNTRRFSVGTHGVRVVGAENAGEMVLGRGPALVQG